MTSLGLVLFHSLGLRNQAPKLLNLPCHIGFLEEILREESRLSTSVRELYKNLVDYLKIVLSN